jgi:hypothetical protein
MKRWDTALAVEHSPVVNGDGFLTTLASRFADQRIHA